MIIFEYRHGDTPPHFSESSRPDLLENEGGCVFSISPTISNITNYPSPPQPNKNKKNNQPKIQKNSFGVFSVISIAMAIHQRNVFLEAKGTGGSFDYIIPATSFSISHSNRLTPSRVLVSGGQGTNAFRQQGEVETKLSMTFPVINTGTGDYPAPFDNSASFNFLSGLLVDGFTGDKFLNFNFAGCQFDTGYLDSVTVTIQPFMPVIASAEFTILAPPTGEFLHIPEIAPDVFYNNILQTDVSNRVAYGHLTTVTDTNAYGNDDRTEIVYKVTCGRTYSRVMSGASPAVAVFLDSIDKEMNIKNTAVGSFINRNGRGDDIRVVPRCIAVNNGGDHDFGMPSTAISMSENARITVQNVSLQDGDIMVGDLNIKENFL